MPPLQYYIILSYNHMITLFHCMSHLQPMWFRKKWKYAGGFSRTGLSCWIVGIWQSKHITHNLQPSYVSFQLLEFFIFFWPQSIKYLVLMADFLGLVTLCISKLIVLILILSCSWLAQGCWHLGFHQIIATDNQPLEGQVRLLSL